MRRHALALGISLCLGSCVSGPGEAPPLSGMRLLDPDLVLDDVQGPLHVRVFPKGALRCDPVAGQVRDAAGMRVLTALPGGGVTPAVRCGAGYSGGVASPVDGCFAKGAPFTVDIPSSGTYLVLVHGQGNIPLPTGGTRPGILGAGCAEVALTEGETRSVTISLREQLPVGTCGDGTLDFDETCDDGPRNGMTGSTCQATCQTVELPVNTGTAGSQRHPSVAWAMSQRLIVAFDNTEDVLARFFTADGAPEVFLGALVNDTPLAQRASVQENPRLVAHAGGFLASWDSFENQRDYEAGAGLFTYDSPNTTPALVGTGMGDQKSTAVAVSGDRALVVWYDGAARELRSAGAALRAPLMASGGIVAVASGEANEPSVAGGDNGFVVVWTAGGDVFARPFSREGAASGEAARVNASPSGTQDQPAVLGVSGGYVVAWRDDSREPGDTDGTTIRWRSLDARGAPTGDTHVAPTTTAGNQARPSLAATPGPVPTVLFVWEDEPGQHIRGRLRTTDDREVRARLGGSGGDFQVSVGEPGQGTRARPSAGYGGPGRFVVAWEGEDGDRTGIRMRIFPP